MKKLGLYLKIHNIYFMKLTTWKVDIAKKIVICKNSYSVNYFSKTLHRRCWTGFWICFGFWIRQGFEHTRILNMPLVQNIPGFRKCQGSKYASGSKYPRFLKMPGFWISQGYREFWICLNRHLFCRRLI